VSLGDSLNVLQGKGLIQRLSTSGWRLQSLSFLGSRAAFRSNGAREAGADRNKIRHQCVWLSGSVACEDDGLPCVNPLDWVPFLGPHHVFTAYRPSFTFSEPKIPLFDFRTSHVGFLKKLRLRDVPAEVEYCTWIRF
jgi:hypothetical protein